MDSSSIDRIGGILTLVKPTGRTLSFVIGDTLKADVLNMVKDGTVSLRIGREIISAKSEIPLTKGDMVLLKVLGFEGDLKLQFLGVESKSISQNIEPQKSLPQDGQSAIPARIFTMLSGLSDAELSGRDVRLLTEIFRSLPEKVRSDFPELKLLEDTLPEIEGLNNQLLKTSVENSGILFETKLKLAALSASDGETISPEQTEMSEEVRTEEPGTLADSPLEGKDGSSRDKGITEDLKGLLLRTREIIRDPEVIGSLKMLGIKPEQAAQVIDRIAKNIEVFQLTSKMNDMLYTFLPLSWHELRDGEVIFKKSKNTDNKSNTYYCTVNLDLERAGKISISVTLYNNSFYVSFKVDNEKTCSLLQSHTVLLEKRFADAGMSLKAVNLTTEEIVLGTVKKEEGIRITI
ncbi:MAG TPA: flagellar hook-length control protein FliK [Thermodesulfovibrionales bacterium]|nr:flagellar hook-length control protein FliK [Thermodesulfovibrionales bacterium]